MKYTLPLAIGAIGLLLGSCASERTTFVKGNAIEWQAKNVTAPQDAPAMVAPEAIAPEETADVPEVSDMRLVQASVELTASVDNNVLTAEEMRPVSALRAMSDVTDMPVAVAVVEQGVKEELASIAPESPAATPGGSKNQTVAAILAFFLGGIGIHRFYLGYTWQGIVQIFTLGGLGIWALIDFIRICIGDLEPKDGSYD